MKRHSLTLVAGLALSSGCGDNSTTFSTPSVNAENPAGSCNFAGMGTCDEYAEVDATSAAADNCTSAGGQWRHTRQCPFEERRGLCTTTSSAATRTYAYTPEAVSSLQAACPQAFVEFEVEEEEMPMPGPMPEPDAGGQPEPDAGEQPDDDGGVVPDDDGGV